MEKNVIFGVDNSSSVHVNGRNKNIWVPYEGLTQSLEYAAITAESKYPFNFIDSEKQFVLSLHYNTIAFYLLIQLKHVNLKQNILKYSHVHYL